MSEHEGMRAEFRTRLRSELLRTAREEGIRSARRRRAVRRLAWALPVLALAAIGVGPTLWTAQKPGVDSSTTGAHSTVAFCALPSGPGEEHDRLQRMTVRAESGDQTHQRVLARCAALRQEAELGRLQFQSGGGETATDGPLALDLRLCLDDRSRLVAGPYPSCEAVGMRPAR